MSPQPKRAPAPRTGLAGFGLAVLAMGCCAGLPLLTALVGSVAIGTVLGVGAGAVVLVALAILAIARSRRRRACAAAVVEPRRAA
jgi:hypothetical protein